MADALEALFDRIWSDLTSAAQGGAPDEWRQLALANVDRLGAPQSRMVILRDVEINAFRLRFHTDVRSAKWEDLAENPMVSLLGYDAHSREQIRLAGQAERFSPGTEVHEAEWQALPLWTRTTYCGGPPGHTVPAPKDPSTRISAPTLEETAHGHARFGVVDVIASALDWYQHPRGDVRRAQFEMRSRRGLQSARWIEP